MKILVTGAAGFVGGHLIDYLNKKDGVDLFGLGLNNVNHSVISANFASCDLLDAQAVYQHISEIKPDFIFHLAAMASVADAWLDPQKVIVNNVIGQLNILKALADLDLKPRILIVSTGEVYGSVDQRDLPISELAALKPTNPYAVSKVTQEFLGLQYFKSHGIPAIIARSFNHSGPGQRGDFVIPSFAEQIVDIEVGKKEPIIRVGNLESERDFLDVRDVVKAYWVLLQKGVAGEVYNVCSGKTKKIKDILNTLLSYSLVEIAVKNDSHRMRPSDTPIVIGSNEKIAKATGWKPTIDFNKTLKDSLDYLRKSTVLEKSV